LYRLSRQAPPTRTPRLLDFPPARHPGNDNDFAPLAGVDEHYGNDSYASVPGAVSSPARQISPGRTSYTGITRDADRMSDERVARRMAEMFPALGSVQPGEVLLLRQRGYQLALDNRARLWAEASRLVLKNRLGTVRKPDADPGDVQDGDVQDGERLYNLDAASVYKGLSVSTLKRRIRAGKLIPSRWTSPQHGGNRSALFTKDDLDASRELLFL
jgi:hypothetical protein